MNTLNAHEVQAMITARPETKLIMVLNPIAFQKAHIPGSQNIYDMSRVDDTLSKDAPIIVYCSDVGCMASYAAYKQLEAAGFTQIWRFAGGLLEWEEAGYPVSKGTPN